MIALSGRDLNTDGILAPDSNSGVNRPVIILRLAKMATCV